MANLQVVDLPIERAAVADAPSNFAGWDFAKQKSLAALVHDGQIDSTIQSHRLGVCRNEVMKRGERSGVEQVVVAKVGHVPSADEVLAETFVRAPRPYRLRPPQLVGFP